jgi:transporter family-2 protein
MPWQALLLGLMAFAAGCGLSVQAAVNGMLARGVGSPITATTISFCVGTTLLVAATLLTRQPLPTMAAARELPPYAWIGGGLLGAFFLFTVIFVTARLGVAVVMSTAIAGQLLAAIALDHFGLLGVAVREASLGRVLGVLVMVVGVVMIRVL